MLSQDNSIELADVAGAVGIQVSDPIQKVVVTSNQVDA
jgi:hypothetical protein